MRTVHPLWMVAGVIATIILSGLLQDKEAGTELVEGLGLPSFEERQCAHSVLLLEPLAVVVESSSEMDEKGNGVIKVEVSNPNNAGEVVLCRYRGWMIQSISAE